ncbi:MAG: TetR/AcrR family transcriptional regulator [Myxococcales bacterium]|nr:TetR/AcrR family transcriptional regulator [Myxococcales bacterium]
MNQRSSPQQARAVATRARVLDAVVGCLAEGGVAATTTGAVAARAGVSQGALFRYFPTKPELLAAGLERLLADLLEDARAGLLAAALADAPIRAGLRALWQVYIDDRLAGAFELFLASRTDDALRAAIEPVLAAHLERELALARAMFPAAAETAGFDAAVVGVLTTLQGAAVSAATKPPSARGESAGTFELMFLEAVVARELGAIVDTDRWTAVLTGFSGPSGERR